MMGLRAFFNGDGDKKEDKYVKAQEDETSLGNILLGLGYVSEKALEVAIKIQKSQMMLGRILVNMGPEQGGITEEQLEEALLEQKVLRKKARAREVIKSNAKRHRRLVGEVRNQLSSLDKKYSIASEE
jgi:hypothetical protein